MSDVGKAKKKRKKRSQDRPASDAPPDAPPSRAKSRGLVAVIGLLAPGLGHAFVGHVRRGAAWAASPALAVVLLASVLPSSTSAGYVVAICGAASLVLYAASIVDAAAISPTRSLRRRWSR
jgi:hypothetical protein